LTREHVTLPTFDDARPQGATKRALVDAFVQLVLERRYDQLKVRDIIARAGVGRSTFYEHYDGKDDLLKAGLSGPFGVLADLVTNRHDPALLQATVEHFWEHRRIGNALFGGPPRGLVTRTLAALIERRLKEIARRRSLPLPASLLAVQIAGGQVALISAWLAGQGSARPDAIAAALGALAMAAVQASPGGLESRV
jgi:AcrR family transcriptional regulator